MNPTYFLVLPRSLLLSLDYFYYVILSTTSSSSNYFNVRASDYSMHHWLAIIIQYRISALLAYWTV